MIRLLIALLLLCVGVSAQAEDKVLAEITVGSGGLICDTADDVRDFISVVEKGNSQQAALDAVEGCGILIRPVLMRVVMVGVHQTAKSTYLIVRYDFLSRPLAPQYGLIAKSEKSSLDI